MSAYTEHLLEQAGARLPLPAPPPPSSIMYDPEGRSYIKTADGWTRADVTPPAVQHTRTAAPPPAPRESWLFPLVVGFAVPGGLWFLGRPSLAVLTLILAAVFGLWWRRFGPAKVFSIMASILGVGLFTLARQGLVLPFFEAPAVSIVSTAPADTGRSADSAPPAAINTDTWPRRAQEALGVPAVQSWPEVAPDVAPPAPPPPAPLPTAQILAQPAAPIAVTVEAYPREYAMPDTGQLYTPAPIMPTFAPYVEPTTIPVPAADYRRETRADGAICVVYQERLHVCDVRGALDDATAEFYASQMQQGLFGQPYQPQPAGAPAAAAPAPGPAQVCTHLMVTKGDTTLGEVMECAATQADADALALAAAEAMKARHP